MHALGKDINTQALRIYHEFRFNSFGQLDFAGNLCYK